MDKLKCPRYFYPKQSTLKIYELIKHLPDKEIYALLEPLKSMSFKVLKEFGPEGYQSITALRTLVEKYPHLALCLHIERFPAMLEEMVEEGKRRLAMLSSINSIVKLAKDTGADNYTHWKKKEGAHGKDHSVNGSPDLREQLSQGSYVPYV